MQRSEAPFLPPFIESMLPAGVIRYRAWVGEHQMHVMELGQGRPVLMLHGNPTWGFLYRKVAEALAGEPLRLIMPDLIGLGFSDKPRDLDAHQLDAHGRWIGALIDGLELDGIVFVGQDWGGPIGLCALASRAERLAGMVLLNTVVGPPRAGFRPTAFHRFSRVPVASDLAFRVAGFPQNLMAAVQGDRRSIRGPVRKAYTYPLRRIGDRAAPLALARMVPDGQQHRSIPALEACQRFVDSYRGPAALVWGERDPVLGRVIGWIEKLLPQAEVTRTRAGHFLQEEVPGDIAAAIRSVVARAA
jgi:cis-3-alkyl-4-acyloxetan-2-one decarboxylase